MVISYSSETYKGASYAVDSIEAGLSDFADSGGIAIVGLDLNTPETMGEEFSILGELLEKEDDTTEFLNWYYEKLEDVGNAVESFLIQSVYTERSSKEGELMTVGTRYGFHETLKIAGGDNIVKENTSSPKVTWEWVITESPDVILLLPNSIDPSIEGLGWNPETNSALIEQLRQNFMTRDGARFIPSVENDKVYVLYRDIFFGPDEVAGHTYLAKILHPQVELEPDEAYS